VISKRSLASVRGAAVRFEYVKQIRRDDMESDDRSRLNCPDVLFKINNGLYALDSYNVQAIMTLPEYKEMPKSQFGVAGVFMFRGKAIPLLSIREIFGMPSIEQEYNDFADMLDQRKQDHINWVNELERTIESGDEFKLATDPHKCAFGRWYDNYTVGNNTVMFHLRKIKDPHEKLHEAAHDVERCKKNCDQCERKECLKDILDRLKKKYMPVILSLLDEAKVVFKDVYRQMVIVVGDEKPVGFMVDEVLAVEHLEDLPKVDASSNILNMEYICGMKKSKRLPDIIMTVNDSRILDMVSGVDAEDYF